MEFWEKSIKDKDFYGLMNLNDEQKDHLQKIINYWKHTDATKGNSCSRRFSYIRGYEYGMRTPSIHYGYVKWRRKIQVARYSKLGLHPELEQSVKDLLLSMNCFEYTCNGIPMTCLFNKNLPFDWHYDSHNNLEYSYLTSFGDYSGGELLIKIAKHMDDDYDFQGMMMIDEDDDNYIYEVDLSKGLFRLPTKYCQHYVRDFEGDRTSMVLYTIS